MGVSARRRTGGWTVCVVLGVLAVALGRPERATGFEYPVVFVQEPAAGQAPAPRTSPGLALEGSRIALLARDGTLSILTQGFAAAADPCVSFGGDRVLFAGKLRADDPWDIWEMEADGSRKVRITDRLGDCREPVYLPRAAVDSPNFRDKVRWITFTSTAPGVLDDLGRRRLTSLYARNLEPVQGRGTVLWRTTHNLGGDTGPTLLSDGRVLFSALQRGAYALMAISWAGSNLNPLYGSHTGMTSQTAACELPDRTVVFVESDGVSQDGSGRLACISLRRPLHSRRLLSDGDGRYRTPHPLPDGRLLVAFSDGSGSFGIHTFDPSKGRDGSPVYDDPAWNDIDAVAVAPRPEPPGRIPTVEFASVLDVGALRTVGQLQCLNVYDSDRPWRYGPGMGEIKGVRLVEGVPRDPSGDAGDAPAPYFARPDSAWPPSGVETRILGEAPVEPDGSFYVNVAGDVPFYLQTLDERGRAVGTMRAWIWVRAGDQRGCIGCHEDKELAPENRATQALVRARPPLLADPPEKRPTVTFRRDVMPIVERRCVGCHEAGMPGGVTLTEDPDGDYNRAYTTLLQPGMNGPAWRRGPYVLPGQSVDSPLADLLIGAPSGVSPMGIGGVHGDLSEDEVRTIITWIDLGARWDSPLVRRDRAGYSPGIGREE